MPDYRQRAPTISRTPRRSPTSSLRSRVKAPASIVALSAAIVLGVAWPWFAAHRAQATVIAARPGLRRLSSARPYGRLLRSAGAARSRRSDHDAHARAPNISSAFAKPATSTTLRARCHGRTSLRLQPQGNVASAGVIASSDIALHRFAAPRRRTRVAAGRSV